MKTFRRPEYKFLFDLIRPFLIPLMGIVFLNFFLSAIALLIPYLIKLQTDQLQAASTDFFGIVYGSPVFIFVLIVGIVVLFNALEHLLSFLGRLSNERVRRNLNLAAETEFFKKLSSLDAGFLDNPRNRRITNSIFNISYIYDRALRIIPETLRNLFSFFGIVPLILIIDYRIGIFTFIMSVIDYLLYRIKIKQENQMTIANEKLQQRIYELGYLLAFHFQKILLIDQSNKVLDTYREKRQQDYRFDFLKFKNSEKWSFIFWVLGNFTSTVITIVFGYQVLQGVFTIGDFTMITLYALQLKEGFSALFKSANEWRSMELDFLRLGFFLNLKPKFHLKEPAYEREIKGDIVFHDVSFAYPSLDEEERRYINFMIERQNIHKGKLKLYYHDESEFSEWENFLKESTKPLPTVLEHFNLTLREGQITSVIGRNGSGKTTSTHLLLRSYDPSKGHITIGGSDLRHIPPAHLRKFVSVLTQNVFLIDSFSIRDNLLLGVQESVSDEKIWSLLERFFLKEKIINLPKKLDTVLGDDIDFSGGQRQLLAIIRTYLQNKPIIIFDEGTNQLDAEHEAMVMDFLQERKARSTVLMITHKLTSARKADQIYVLDNGKIIESGSHTDLLQKHGLYSKFWKIQVVD